MASAVAALEARLLAQGAVLKLAPQGRAATLNEGLAPLIARGLIGADLRPKPGCDALLAFYAAPIWQRLEDAATRQT